MTQRIRAELQWLGGKHDANVSVVFLTRVGNQPGPQHRRRYNSLAHVADQVVKQMCDDILPINSMVCLGATCLSTTRHSNVATNQPHSLVIQISVQPDTEKPPTVMSFRATLAGKRELNAYEKLLPTPTANLFLTDIARVR